MKDPQYQWLWELQAPKMLAEALKLYGTKEYVGPKHNPVIMGWAEELGISGIYKSDETAWCGLAMAICAKRAGKEIPMKGWDMLRALKWKEFGVRAMVPMLGDVMVFYRKGGGHVGLYVGESATRFHILGGNQSNTFNIMELEKVRAVAVRRPLYSVQPDTVKVIHLNSNGRISKNEA